MTNPHSIFGHIDDLKNQLDAHRPLSAQTLKMLNDDLAVRFTYHSNAIEGNTLTLLETKVVLEEITPLAEKPCEKILKPSIINKPLIIFLKSPNNKY